MSENTINTDVHSMELTIQSLLEGPLELLNSHLKNLYDSQVILRSILDKMENTLVKTGNNLRPGTFHIEGEDEDEVIRNERVDLDDYLKRLVRIRDKVKKIEDIIEVVEKRVNRMESMMIGDDDEEEEGDEEDEV